jgi:hypothetical protein
MGGYGCRELSRFSRNVPNGSRGFSRTSRAPFRAREEREREIGRECCSVWNNYRRTADALLQACSAIGEHLAMSGTNSSAKRAVPLSAPSTVDKSRAVQVHVQPGETQDRAVAGMVARGMVTNASTVIRYQSHEHEGLSLMDMTDELRAQGEAVNGGDLSALERTLTAQALSLNAIFAELARVAQSNLFKVPSVAERYLRLALKAQGQSRATVETLAAMKNPPVVFARQANINNGGQQQVNNGAALNSTHASARTEEGVSGPNELLEELMHGRTQLDRRATTATIRTHPGVDPLGALDRTDNR